MLRAGFEKIAVIGYKGIVGGATYVLLQRLGYDPVGIEKGDPMQSAKIYFICVPEKDVPDVVQSIPNSTIISGPLIVIRSSITPGTSKRLSNINDGIHICHLPEFLREAIYIQDSFNPSKVVIGECCNHHGNLLESIFKKLGCKIVRTDTTTSEMVKMASNCYFSTIISYWNNIEECCRMFGISGHEVGMISSLDPRISTYGSRFHQKYGGKCLPKDMKQMIEWMKINHIDSKFFEAVEEVNNRQPEV